MLNVTPLHTAQRPYKSFSSFFEVTNQLVKMSKDSNMKPCALLFGEAGPIIAATPSLGLQTKVEMNFHGRINGVSFFEVLHQRAFSFVVELPIGSCKESMGDQNFSGLFTYGYAYQPANVQEMMALADKSKGGAFSPCYAFDNDDAHITTINQSVIQDTLWVHREAELIAEERLPAYFVTPISAVSEGHAIHLVVPVPKGWSGRHLLAWPRLNTGNPLIKVKIHDVSTPGYTGPALWTGKIIGSNNSAPKLRTHPIQDHELIEWQKWGKKVSNMRIFGPSALPTNRQAWCMALDGAENILAPHMLDADQRQTYNRVMFQMEVHRAVLRGTGFYEVLSRKTKGLSIGALPSMCYRLYDDRYLMQCIIEEAGYHHRNRFREYLMGRELNIGPIIDPPGSGKTTIGAAAALVVQAQLGQILCSGPSHASIDIFADRLDQRARAVAARYNTIMPAGDVDRCHHRLVIRMYRPGNEINAVTQLSMNPQDVDWAARRVLRSNAVPPLHVDSKPGLVNLQADIDARPALLHLRQWATGQISSQQYAATPGAISNIDNVLCEIMCQADFLCVHLSDAEISPIPHWKRILAQGLAVDEAGSIGDPNQDPVVHTTDERDADGNLYNRFATDGAVSPMKFLMATGIPVFRLEDSTRH
ncbi:hypothetical protein Forpe1208_v014139 [Fusarium oxysporum f. sp. rapae]|uniref:DNA2/NAM7 helicase helicase domain-containing protein n=1 Tax=Fusarium oxysporum f. sp. rapae TaxID=485398 RepID=A0A8J5U0W0_FUSOX|nr:hypothetical protein Forpe1208_v014139 [Fusarium oxysporum f. sp. rapae]